jgi:hemerythrin-like domain-containing protein
MTALETASADKTAAVEIIRTEHAALGEVLGLLQRTLRDLEAGIGEPDFGLLSLALYYLDDFPYRCHHPKEERCLFPAVRRHTRQFDTVLNQLDAEHAGDTYRLRDLDRALVRYQAGAPQGLRTFRAAVDLYAAVLYEHMRREEGMLQALELPAAEWRAIATAFAEDEEPLVAGHRRGEFGRLRDRIVSRLASRLRFHRNDDA